MSSRFGDRRGCARKQRSLSERIYCHGYKLVTDESGVASSVELRVEGQTGNIYDVQGRRCDDSCDDTHERPLTLTCSCPDFEKRQSTCKHIYFCIYKVFEVSSVAQLFWKDVIARIAARDLFLASHAHAHGGNDADDRDDDRDTHLSNKRRKREPTVVQRDYIGEDCPICFDEMSVSDDVEWCRKQCGKSFHGECLTKWARRHSVCPLCRADL